MRLDQEDAAGMRTEPSRDFDHEPARTDPAGSEPPDHEASEPSSQAHPGTAHGYDEAGRPDIARIKLKKAPNAFRTISEVADDLHIPQHVLRFWETKFPQVKPLKRGGGRRYYRPDDISLLRRISDLLYIQGYTIKGVQRLLREGGGKLSDDIPPATADEQAAAAAERAGALAKPDDAQPSLLEPADPEAEAEPERTAREAVETEVTLLRSVLASTLHELESLRALLP